jgi:hypothetical protein
MTCPDQLPAPSRDDAGTITCPICQRPFTPAGRQQCCSTACRNTAWRRGHQDRASPPAIPPSRPRREFTIYECPDRGQRLFGEQRCPDRGIFATRLGTGEPCPHRGEPVTITDLLQEVVTTPGNR